MNIVVEKSCQAIGREGWNSLLSRSVTNTIFQTYAWHRAFEAAYSGGHTGYILCGMEGDDLTGIAPFCLCRSRGETIVRFLGYERADYCDLIYPESKKEFVAEAFSFLKSRSGEWDRIELANISELSPTLSLISEACKKLHLISSRGDRTPCPALVFNDAGNPFAALLEKKSIVRHHRYFSKKQDFRVTHFVRGEEISQRLPAFFDQHMARWSATDFPSLFLDQSHRDFYGNLAREMASDGGLLFTEIVADNRPVAFHFGFAYNRRLLWYKPSFDILLADRSPGEALLKELMIFVRTSGLDELDFTIGDEAFKRRFSNVVRYNVSLNIYKNYGNYFSAGTRRLMKSAMNGLPSALRKAVIPAVEIVRENGFRSAVQKCIVAVSRFLYCRESVIVYSRREDEPGGLETVPGRENFTVRQGTLEDVIRFSAYRTGRERHQTVGDAVRRFRDGETLFVTLQGEILAGIAWVSAVASTDLGEIGYRLRIPQDSILLTVWITAPHFLKRHVFILLLDLISAKFPGKSKIICCGEKNTKPRYGMEQLFSGDKVIRMVSICGLRFHSVKPFGRDVAPRL